MGLHRYTALLTLLCLGTAALADEYAAARARLVHAYQEGDFSAMRTAAGQALDARPGYPGALFNLALAQALDQDLAASLSTLIQLADMQLDFGVDAMDEFAALRAHPGWDRYLQQLEPLRQPAGTARVAFTLSQADFVPEGIAVAAGPTLYLGSIRHGRIVRVDPGGQAELLSEPGTGDHWSVFGMRLDGLGGLWFASAAVAQMAAVEETQLGRSGLFRLDLDSGKLSQRALLPEDDREHVLGDLLLADDGLMYTTDSLTGMVYRFRPGTQRFEALIPEGVLNSPQGLALDAGQQGLYVADYTGGVFRLDLASGAIRPLAAPKQVSLYGVDGLYRHGNSLIAIQNGLRPHRVVRWDLSPGGDAIISATVLAMNLPQFDEPTLGAVLGDSFYFVANSHWNRFGRDNTLPGDLSGPIVMRIDLGAESGSP